MQLDGFSAKYKAEKGKKWPRWPAGGQRRSDLIKFVPFVAAIFFAMKSIFHFEPA